MKLKQKISRRKFTEPRIWRLLNRLSKSNSRLWKAVADKLATPRRNRAEVNVSKINRLANDNDAIVVPGKVLGSGILNKKVKVVAYDFSKSAIEKIEKAGGTVARIEDEFESNPEGKDLKLVI